MTRQWTAEGTELARKVLRRVRKWIRGDVDLYVRGLPMEEHYDEDTLDCFIVNPYWAAVEWWQTRKGKRTPAGSEALALLRKASQLDNDMTEAERADVDTALTLLKRIA